MMVHKYVLSVTLNSPSPFIMPRTAKNTSTPVLPKISSSTPNHSPPVRGVTHSASDGSEITLALLAEKLDLITSRLDKLDSVHDSLREMEGRLANVMQDNARLEVKVANLEDRLDMLEMAGRRNNLVLSGDAVTNIPPTDNLSDAVTRLLRSAVQYELQRPGLSTALRLGVRPSHNSPDKRSVLLKLQNEETKKDILLACRRVRPRGLFANEDLTPHRASLLFALRRAKKSANGKMTGCGSYNGRVFMYLQPPNPDARQQRVYVESFDKLKKLCLQELDISYDELMSQINTT